MNKLSITLTACSIILLLLFGCRKLADIDEVTLGDIDPEFAIPLFKTKATLNEMLDKLDDNTFVTFGEDGLVILNYKGDFVTRSSEDIFDIITSGGFPVEDTLVRYYFDLPTSIDLDFAHLSAGTVGYLFNSYHEQDVDVTMTFPQLTKNGIPFTMERFVNYGGTTPIPAFSLANEVEGYTLDLAESYDTIIFRYEAMLEDGMRDTLSDFAVLMEGFQFSFIQGYLGEDIYELPRDTIFIEFFENWTQGNVYFVEPLLKITVANSFGFPVRSNIDFINIITVDGSVLPLESPYEDSLYIDYPLPDEVGETKYSEFLFTHENSNIAEILGSGPVAVDYLLSALPNPDSILAIRGFATDSSVFAVQVEVELPFYGLADDFLAFDTIGVDTFDLSADFSVEENVKTAEFKLITENTLPVGVALQVAFADENGEVLDYLFEETTQFIEPAPTDANGDVTDMAEKTFFINVDAARFEKIKGTKQLFLNTSFSTSQDGAIPVKVKANQDVGIRMGVKFVYNN